MKQLEQQTPPLLAGRSRSIHDGGILGQS